MAENKTVQILWRKSRPLTKIVASAAIVLSILALISLYLVQSNIQEKTDTMRAEAARLQQENSRLQEKIDRLGSVQSVEEIAQEELGLVDPDTVIVESD